LVATATFVPVADGLGEALAADVDGLDPPQAAASTAMTITPPIPGSVLCMYPKYPPGLHEPDYSGVT